MLLTPWTYKGGQKKKCVGRVQERLELFVPLCFLSIFRFVICTFDSLWKREKNERKLLKINKMKIDYLRKRTKIRKKKGNIKRA